MNIGRLYFPSGFPPAAGAISFFKDNFRTHGNGRGLCMGIQVLYGTLQKIGVPSVIIIMQHQISAFSLIQPQLR